MDKNLEGSDKKKKRKRKSKNKTRLSKNVKISIGVSAAVIIVGLIGGGVYVKTSVEKYKEAIYPGMKIQGMDLSGKNKEDAIKIINENYTKAMNEKRIVIKSKDKEYDIKYSDLGLTFDYENTVDEVLKEGKDKDLFEKFKMIKYPKEKDHEIKFTYNEAPVNEKIKNVAKELNKNKVEATISGYGGNFNITDEQVGYKVDEESLKKDILKHIAESKIDEKEVVVEVKLIEDKPKITKAELKKVDTLMSSYSTSYAGGTIDRSTNIEICTNTINGKVLMPGESFSFNNIVGDTTPDKGYLEGGVYVGNKLEKGYGGGICQVSSTLHNAVIRMGILPDQRLNHNMTVGYVPLGLDATIAYPYIDYVFTNPTKFPLYIEGVAGGGTVQFNIYGNSAAKSSKTYEFTSETYETIAATAQYEDDPTLPEGKEVVVQQGVDGCKVKAYRLTYENGALINQELMNNDTYAAMPTTIKRGTAKVQKPAEPPKRRTT